MLHLIFSHFESASKSIRVRLVCSAFALSICVIAGFNVRAQTTEFTYQGQLENAGAPANGSHDFIFVLFDALTGGAQVGPLLMRNGVTVTGGLFAVKLDFGSEFPGAPRFMQISVRQLPNIHTQLEPRQQINSAPYSIKSLASDTAANATNATNALQLGGVAANQFVVTTDPRMTDARNPLSGNAAYIQNGVGQQASSNFNITGTGTANILNAGTQLNLNNQRILSNGGTGNLFAGVSAGAANSGTDNSFFGFFAGLNNSTGSFNTFFGSLAGRANQSGTQNSFFGSAAGNGNTTGSFNSFFGRATGNANTIGEKNAIFGDSAGFNNVGGSNNSFFGWQSGFNNNANANTFVGSRAGAANTTGAQNSFFGNDAGSVNTTGGGNAFFGSQAGLNSTGGNNSFFGSGSGANTTSGAGNAFFGGSAGTDNTLGSNNTFVGGGAGTRNTSGGSNSFFGLFAGAFNTTGNNNVFIGNSAGPPTAATQINNSVAIGTSASVTTSNTIVLGTTAETTRIPGLLNVSDAGGGNFRLRVVNTAAGGGVVAPNFYLPSFPQGPSGIPLCWKAASDGVAANIITNCISFFSPGGMRTDVKPFSGGLDVIKRLKPVTYKWKTDGKSGIGLNAEDVADVAPDLVTRNAKGEAEDINEHGLNILFINAIKEQQTHIEKLAEQNRRQQSIIESLVKSICKQDPNDAVCKEEK